MEIVEKGSILNKNCFYKVSISIIKFALKTVYFGTFLVWKLLFKRNIPTNGSVKLTGTIWKSWYRMSGKVLPIFAGLRRLQVLSKCGFPKALLILCKFTCRRPFGKTDPILNNYLIQTMENNAHSGVRRVQAEKSFIFIFPSAARTEKDQRCLLESSINVQTT